MAVLKLPVVLLARALTPVAVLAPPVVLLNDAWTRWRLPVAAKPGSRLLLASQNEVRLFQDIVELPSDSIAILITGYHSY